jgi:hypothetical protein
LLLNSFVYHTLFCYFFCQVFTEAHHELWDRVLEYSLKQKAGVSNQISLDAMTMSQGNYFLDKAFSRKNIDNE